MDRLKTKKGFTLIELLIVTVVVAMLMAVLFRLTGVAGNASARETTVARMQKLENCLSGYYATFGTYPPVPLQGATRNIYRKTTDEHPTIQSDNPLDLDDTNEEFFKYHSVDAACRAQPVAAMFPPPRYLTLPSGNTVSSKDAYENFQAAVQAAYSSEAFDDYSDSDKEKIASWKDATIQDIGNSPGFLNSYQDETDSTKLQLFRYGLMSFLLPRYRFMLDCARGGGGNTEAFNNSIDRYKQWTEFNPLPPRMDTGIAFESWKAFCDTMNDEEESWKIDLIPSQAACARWMPNLKDMVAGPDKTFFGVNVGFDSNKTGIPDVKDAASFTLYSAGGRNSSSAHGYPLQSLTVRDAWGVDFYYYSPPPHQMYVLWSAGANRKTFPPWVDLEQFQKDHQPQFARAVEWMADDIKFMSTGK